MAGTILKNDPRHPGHPQYDAVSKARAAALKSVAKPETKPETKSPTATNQSNK